MRFVLANFVSAEKCVDFSTGSTGFFSEADMCFILWAKLAEIFTGDSLNRELDL